MELMPLPGFFPGFDAEEAEARKAKGIGLALSVVSSPRIQAKEIIGQLARSSGEFTSDDVYTIAGEQGAPLPEDMNMGCLFNAASRSGLIVPVWCPSRKSKRPNSHARTVKVWRGQQAA